MLESVSYEYATGTPLARAAVRGLNLEVGPGQLVCVLGPTGSGKTTMLLLAAGLLEPTAGSVSADGAPVGIVKRDGGETRCLVGIAFQRPESQMFADTVVQDVEFGPRNLGASVEAARTAAEGALEAVGLDPGAFGSRSPFTLSGGEARRAALAGVLAMSPAYLLLDEPTAGLDARGRAAVAEAVGRAREAAGVVVVTHDAEEFLEDADAVLVLDDGAAAYSGDVGGLLACAGELEREGSWTPPEIVRVQLLAGHEGRLTGSPSLDPAQAAVRLVGGGERP